MIRQFSKILLLSTLAILPFSCKKDSDSKSPSGEKLPQFNNPSSSPVLEITSNSARFDVTISGDGGSAIKVRGVVWNTNSAPTVALSTKTTDSSGTGSFSVFLSDLLPKTKYYARAYATNANGTSYGKEFDFTTENEAANLPVFNNPNSSPISDITATSAKFLVNISSDGGFAITSRGVCWSTNSGPAANLSTKTSDGTGTGNYTSNLSGLTANTKYYARAYATNSNGTSYGLEFSFTTLTSGGNTGSVTDVDGNTYQTVQIGPQTWMAENLKTSKYRDGTLISTNLNNTDWYSTTSGGYALYNNDIANNTTYGKLYNWYAVVDSKNLCPIGWHVPSDEEWKTLGAFLGGSGVAGGKLKSTSSLWTTPNSKATNQTGFSGLPGGYRGFNGIFSDIGKYGHWWSSTEYFAEDAYFRSLYYTDGYLYSGSYGAGKQAGRSVRCIKD